MSPVWWVSPLGSCVFIQLSPLDTKTWAPKQTHTHKHTHIQIFTFGVIMLNSFYISNLQVNDWFIHLLWSKFVCLNALFLNKISIRFAYMFTFTELYRKDTYIKTYNNMQRSNSLGMQPNMNAIIELRFVKLHTVVI